MPYITTDRKIIQKNFNNYKDYTFSYLYKNPRNRKRNILVLSVLVLIILFIFLIELPYPVIGFILVSNFFLMLLIMFNAMVVWIYGEKTEIARFNHLSKEETLKNLHSSLFTQFLFSFFLN